MQAYKIRLNFVDTNMKYETLFENNKCWYCGHLNSIYVLLEHPVWYMKLPPACLLSWGSTYFWF